MPRALVTLGRLLAQAENTPMNIRILFGIILRQGIDHSQRLLRRRRVIQIRERLAVDLFPEDREVFSYLFYIEYFRIG